jgi:hypothetical protein
MIKLTTLIENNGSVKYMPTNDRKELKHINTKKTILNQITSETQELLP